MPSPSSKAEQGLPSRPTIHPYLTGNYRSLDQEHHLAPVSFSGSLPKELASSLYARNGANASPRNNANPEIDFHWFDGYGAVAAVHFKLLPDGRISPEFAYRYLLTDVYLHDKASVGHRAILPSVATLLGSFWNIHLILWAVIRSAILVFLSIFSDTPVYRLSAANTALVHHDGRALATCESGPPLWISLPNLDTVDWFGLEGADGTSLRKNGGTSAMTNEFTTAHPKKDEETDELILFHASFTPPYLRYSVIPTEKSPPEARRILAAPVPIPAARMMHDFAASKRHSILIDCPLSLDPKNLMRGKPVVHYSPNTATRFGVLPRHRPDQVRWFAHDSCIIFHTANAWDEPDRDAVSLVCCRMNSSALVYAAGNMAAPPSAEPVEEVCQLYFYEFHLSAADPTPAAAFPLSVIPMEFPEVSRHTFLRKARYVYGCSMGEGTFGASLGKAARMDCIVKMDVLALSERGQQRGEAGENETVDRRSVGEVLASARPRGDFAVDPDSIRVFRFPPLHHGQEVSFVPRAKQRGEDDGYLLTLVFDDGQLLPSGEAPPSAISELWVIDAWDMKTVVAKVHLPQRVPTGLHGEWFSADEVANQRHVPQLRSIPDGSKPRKGLVASASRYIQHLLD